MRNIFPFHERVFLILGKGNREAFFAERLAREGCSVAMIPGNAAACGNENIQLHASEDPFTFALQLFNDGVLACVIVGPEEYLASDLVDRLKVRGVPVVAPSRANAELEISKWFFGNDVRQAVGFRMPETIFCDQDDMYAKSVANSFLKQDDSVVIKAEGLTGARGVQVCTTSSSAESFIDFCTSKLRTREWLGSLLVQQRIRGREISYLALTDSSRYYEFPPYVDHKLTPDGKMCGGLGGYSPVPYATKKHMSYFRNQVVLPTLSFMRERAGYAYTGFIFVGGIIDEEGTLWILEWNVRMGDPEVMAALSRVVTPLSTLLRSLVTVGVHEDIEIDDQVNSGVLVLATPEYPEAPSCEPRFVSGLEEMRKRFPQVQFVPGGLACDPSPPDPHKHLRIVSGRACALVRTAPLWNDVHEELLGAAKMLKIWHEGGVTEPFQYREDMFRGLTWGNTPSI